MASSLFTITLGVSRENALPVKSPLDIRFCTLDCTDWLKAAGTTIVTAPVTASRSLAVGNITHNGKVVQFTVQGGIASTRPVIGFALILANGGRENVSFSQPVDNLSPSLESLPPITLSSGDGTTPETQASVGAMTLAAGAALSGHRALMLDGHGGVVHADPSSPDYRFIGISNAAAGMGSPVAVVQSGFLMEPTWSWTPGQPLYVAPGGILTQTAPDSGVWQQLAVALSPTAILIQPFAPINLI